MTTNLKTLLQDTKPWEASWNDTKPFKWDGSLLTFDFKYASTAENLDEIDALRKDLKTCLLKWVEEIGK